MNTFFRTLAFCAIIHYWLPCAYATSIVILPEGEQEEATVKFVWNNPVEITITGGRIPDSYRITVPPGGINIGRALLNEKSSQDLFEYAAGMFYNNAINAVGERKIFKYIVKQKILPEYVQMLPDGTITCKKYQMETSRHYIIIKIITKLKSGEVLGTATYDKDSHKITWESSNKES